MYAVRYASSESVTSIRLLFRLEGLMNTFIVKTHDSVRDKIRHIYLGRPYL